MDDSGPIPTKVSCIYFTINGFRIEPFVNIIRVYEDICKPYRTATVLIIDNSNIINTLQLQGGEIVKFIVLADAYTGVGGYSAAMKILKIKKQKPNYGLRTNYYELDLIDFEYFGDRANLVQESIKGQPGTSAISMIHGKYVGGSGLSVLNSSAGLIGQNNPYVIRSVKPFTAIDQIRRLLTFPAYPSGANVYFHDRTNVKFAAFEYLYDTASPAQHFIQRATWGARWQDVFELTNGIFASETTTTDQSGSGGVVDKSAVESAERKVANLFSGKRIFNQMAGGGMHGGRHNYQKVDSEKIPKENTRNTPAENKFRAKLGDGIHLTIKVPSQTGLNVTVGGGFSAEIQPPAGDLDDAGPSMLTGNYLCIKLVHEFHFDETELQGTASIEGLKQGQ